MKYRNIESLGVRVSVALAILAIAAFSSRLMPLSFSPYPFNNDSLTESRMASDILASGHLEYSVGSPWSNSQGIYTPVLDVLLAFFSSSIGINPVWCAQVLAAALSLLSVCGIFILGRLISGSPFGGLVAGFAGLMMGTFVFTTASAWKEALGIALLVLLFVSFARRSSSQFRILGIIIFLVIPFVHHLVAVVAVLAMSYMLVWIWYFAVAYGNLGGRHVIDLLMVAFPSVVAVSYYEYVSFDRFRSFSSPFETALLIASFVLLCTVSILVLSLKRHSKTTFAPIIGLFFFVVLAADYVGLVFPYTPSVSSFYFVLVGSVGLLVAVAWFGTEIVLEHYPSYRAIQLALFLSPLTIIGLGIYRGFSNFSHQITYRTFDFFDVFIFVGLGAAVVFLSNQRGKAYRVVGPAIVVALVLSFPFAYYSEDLLGVRHDTNRFEVDALDWIAQHDESPWVVTDERLSYIASSIAGLPKDAGLPTDLHHNITLPLGLYCLYEESWMTKGVNNYPYGRTVIPRDNITRTTDAANVLYVGGPVSDLAIVYSPSAVGETLLFGTSR